MTDTAEQVKDVLLDAVIDLAERRRSPSGVPVDAVMLKHYFDRTPAQDLVDQDPIDLYAAAVRHFQLGETRAPAETLVRIYNPNSDEDGWSSSHTVIDVFGQDMPFIVDSVLALLRRLGYQVHVLVHPMFHVTRSEAGHIESVAPPPPDEEDLESLLHIEVDRIMAGDERRRLEGEIRAVLEDVRAAVEDWHAMRTRALELADELDAWAREAETGKARYITTIGSEPEEVAELLRWMESGMFTFVGYREYDFIDDEEHPLIVSRPETGLGTMRQTERTTRDLGRLPPETAEQSRKPNVLNLTKANTHSTVHRAVPLDYVGIKEIDENGRVTGERRLLGLFTSAVYTGRVEDIPSVRRKVAAVTERAAFHSTSHDHNRLLNTLQTYPRDELFSIEVDELEDMALAILDLRDRPQVSLLLRRDTFGRFLSCLVFIPRDRHNTDVRLAVQRTLMEVYQGISSRFSTEISDAPLARLHIVIYTDPTPADQLPDVAAVEARLIQLTRTWDDFLRTSLVETYGEDRGLALLGRYGNAFDASYRANVLAESAVHDIERIEAVEPGGIDVFLHRPLEAGRLELRCKIYRSGDPITLSQFIPLLHDLGAVVTDERPYVVEVEGEDRRYVYDIGLRMRTELERDDRLRVRDALLAVWSGEAESDALARLVAAAHLSWRDVTVLRAYTRHLIQIGARFSSAYIIETLNGNPQIARLLVERFKARFDPDRPPTDSGSELYAAIDSVVSLDADRILRLMVAVIDATVRTNHWQRGPNGELRPALALKLDPGSIPDLPKPVPMAEIFVYSPRTEGVHLRSGRVARGGLRWSDRMEDYRTEVLGLMKAQTVKNSVIVPVGAKGGFVARSLPVNGTRDETMAEVIACYQTFVGALLDVTDNVVDDVVVPPTDVVRHDGDDPYLVVAADKGTATFSDIANAIAQARHFWLDDAFASGGSDGYDHKALAITARGAWVSVERHFRELGLNPATTPFTAVGIGDMSGDVFGNGLLRSPITQLVAAFDHRHIFVDPNPDPAVSFAERKRLYDLPRSSWDDYTRALISEGGGVFARTAKSIDVTEQMRAALDLDIGIERLTPDELIRAVLAAPVDLLWNGGIGTYVKSSREIHAEAGDRNNDSVRIDASELRAQVVGEGGNLGFTQRGRIEFASLGGRINTDAIDNSGGVDCSDHEVNLKILLSVAERNGDLTRKQRNELLEAMADQVCDHVLENNYSQNETLSAAVAQAPGMVQVHERLMCWLEAEGSLDRFIEALPSELELQQRQTQGLGLTRPELAVMLAYTKNTVTAELAEDVSLTSDPAFDELLADYFPSLVRDRHADLVRNHPLRNELLAMILSNQMVNTGGMSMHHRLMDETSATVSDICRAHVASWRLYELDGLWKEVRALDFEVPAAVQTEMSLAIKRLGERATRWLLRNEAQPLDLRSVVARYGPAIRALADHAEAVEVPEDVLEDIDRFVAEGVPRALASRVASLGLAFGFLDLSNVALRTDTGLVDVADVHALLDEELELSALRELIVDLPRDDHWQTMARSVLRDQYFLEHAELSASVLTSNGAHAGRSPDEIVDRWLRENKAAAERCRRTFAEIRAAEHHDLAHASVALRALGQLRRTT